MALDTSQLQPWGSYEKSAIHEFHVFSLPVSSTCIDKRISATRSWMVTVLQHYCLSGGGSLHSSRGLVPALGVCERNVVHEPFLRGPAQGSDHRLFSAKSPAVSLWVSSIHGRLISSEITLLSGSDPGTSLRDSTVAVFVSCRSPSSSRFPGELYRWKRKLSQ